MKVVNFRMLQAPRNILKFTTLVRRHIPEPKVMLPDVYGDVTWGTFNKKNRVINFY